MRPLSASCRSRRASAVALVLVLSGVSTSVPVARAAPEPAGAQSPPPIKVDAVSHDRAQKAYQESLKLYKNGQYRAAVDKLIEARKLDPTAKELPYNLGLVHEKLNNLDDSIRNFEIYLSLETDEAEKDRVRGIIQRLQGARAEQLRAQPSASTSATTSARPPPPPPTATATASAPVDTTPVERRRGRLDGLVYGTGSLAVIGAVAGTVLGTLALSKRPADADKDLKTGRQAQSDAHKFAIGADIGFGVAIAAGGTALLLYLLRKEPAPDTASSTGFLAPAPGGLTGGWQGRF